MVCAPPRGQAPGKGLRAAGPEPRTRSTSGSQVADRLDLQGSLSGRAVVRGGGGGGGAGRGSRDVHGSTALGAAGRAAVRCDARSPAVLPRPRLAPLSNSLLAVGVLLQHLKGVLQPGRSAARPAAGRVWGSPRHNSYRPEGEGGARGRLQRGCPDPNAERLMEQPKGHTISVCIPIQLAPARRLRGSLKASTPSQNKAIPAKRFDVHMVQEPVGVEPRARRVHATWVMGATSH